MFKKLLVKNFKNLFLFPVLLISGIFIFLPDLCYANPSMGFLIDKGPFVFILTMCLGVLIIEAFVIKQKLGVEPKKALLASFVINIITAILGYFFFKYDLFSILGNLLVDNLAEMTGILILFLVLFFSNVIIEAIILFFFYKKISLSKLFKASFFMNAESHCFLIILFVGSMVSTFSVIIIFFVFYFTISYVLDSFFANKITKKNIIAISILLPIILSGIILYEMLINESSDGGGRPKSRDARRQSDIRQINTACELYYTDDEKYPVAYNFEDIKSKGINPYMEIVPNDPRGGDYYYIWINNTGIGDDQYFCVYAESEHSNDTWYIGSEKGVTKTNIEPTGLGDDCW